MDLAVWPLTDAILPLVLVLGAGPLRGEVPGAVQGVSVGPALESLLTIKEN